TPSISLRHRPPLPHSPVRTILRIAALQNRLPPTLRATASPPEPIASLRAVDVSGSETHTGGCAGAATGRAPRCLRGGRRRLRGLRTSVQLAVAKGPREQEGYRPSDQGGGERCRHRLGECVVGASGDLRDQGPC